MNSLPPSLLPPPLYPDFISVPHTHTKSVVAESRLVIRSSTLWFFSLFFFLYFLYLFYFIFTRAATRKPLNEPACRKLWDAGILATFTSRASRSYERAGFRSDSSAASVMPITKQPKKCEPLWKEWDFKAQKKGVHHTVYSVNGDQYTGDWNNNKKNGTSLARSDVCQPGHSHQAPSSVQCQ